MAPPAGDHKADLLQSVVENSQRMIQRVSEGHSDLVMAIHRHSKSMMEDVTEKSIELMSSVSENITAVLRDLTEVMDRSPKVVFDFENSMDMTVQKLLDTRDGNLQNVSSDATSLILSVAENNSNCLQSLQSLNMCENSMEYKPFETSAIDAVRESVVSSKEGTVAVDVKDEQTDEVVECNETEQADEVVECNEAEQADASDEDLVPAASKTEKTNSSPIKTDIKRTSKVNAKKGKLKSKAGLVIKRQKVGRPSGSGKKVNPCPECGKVFGRSGHLKEHMLIHSKERNFICSFCEKTFKTPRNLQAHLLLHSDAKHTCSVCNKKFLRVTSLKEHMLYHRDERPNVCELCGKAYFLRQQLRDHKKVKHGIGDDKVFQCNICGKEFLLRRRLRAHQHRVHTEKEKIVVQVQCEICGTKVSKAGLTTHMQLHGDVITCELCGKTFRHMSYYRIHKRIHTGDKPYKCSECDYASVDWSNLQKHTKTHRKKVVVEPVVQPGAINTTEESIADSNLD